ncbi:MAG TPA: hypothetical protein VF102_01455 [Gemmatimonadaceae bacterium]
MTREHLEAQFAERGMPHAGGLLVLAPDAIELVRAAEREDIPILGVDGFFISPTETISPLEHLADFSAAAATGRGTWRDAEGFIASRRTLGLTFEVTLGEPLLPAG